MLTECIICMELMSPAADIAVVKCGHLFHRSCLEGWISKQSRTCPQCRSTVTSDCIIRLFPTVPNVAEVEESSLLQSCLDETQSQLNQQKALCQAKEDKLKALEADFKKKEELLKSYEQKLQQLERSKQQTSRREVSGNVTNSTGGSVSNSNPRVFRFSDNPSSTQAQSHANAQPRSSTGNSLRDAARPLSGLEPLPLLKPLPYLSMPPGLDEALNAAFKREVQSRLNQLRRNP